MLNMPDRLRIAHIINLKEVGGLQRMYIHFINHAFDHIQIENYTLNEARKIAPALQAHVRKGSEWAQSIQKFAFLKNWTIPEKPRLVKDLYSKLLIRKIKPEIGVAWSTPEGLKYLIQSRTNPIYYEHGASWYVDDKAKMRECLLRASCIICNSLAAKRLIQLRWDMVNEMRIEVCLNPVLPDCLPVSVQTRKFPVDRPFRLGCAGRLAGVKGFPLAIHAVAELRTRGINCELYVAGTGPELEMLKALCRKLGVEREVRFLGFVKEMGAFFSQIHCFLCPSVREPFGLVCAEAMAYGCPVIASGVDGLPEVVGDGETGFCVTPTLAIDAYETLGGNKDDLPKYVYDPVGDKIVTPKLLDPAMIADAVEVLINDQGLFHRMGRAATVVAREKFDFNRYAANLLKILLNA